MTFYDTRLLAKLLGYPDCSLKGLVANLLGLAVTTYSKAINSSSNAFREYAKKDAEITHKLFMYLDQQIKKFGLEKLSEIEHFFALISFECEQNGVTLNIEKLDGILKGLKARTEELIKSLNEGLPKPINWKSPKQVCEVLAFEMNTPVVIDKGRPSTGKSSLKKIQHSHPKISKLLELKQLEAMSRLIKKTLKFVDPATNKLYPYYDTFGADTGRATSRNPNMQNVPKESGIREVFCASLNNSLLRFDFGQIEPRILANFVLDSNFANLFYSENDYYKEIGELLFKGINTAISSRDAAKVFQLSLLYGAGEKSLAEKIGVEPKTASKIMNRFDHLFPEVDQFRQSVLNHARETGYAVGLLGRRRHLPDITSHDPYQRFRAERQAFNAVIQGSAATLFKFKAGELRKSLPLDAKFLLHVHDELVLEVPKRKSQEYLKKSISVLEAPVPWFSIPLKVDGGIGKNWLEAKSKGGIQ